MDFGLFYTLLAPSSRPAVDAYADYLHVAREAERLGYRSIYSTEHHFGSDPQYRPFGMSEPEYSNIDYDIVPDPLTLMAWVAAQTKTIKLGTALQILHWDHPLRTAERAAMVDAFSRGRLELGVGKGQGFREARVFNVINVDDDANTRKFNEAVEIIRRAWTGDVFSFQGEFYQFENLSLRPRPFSKQPPLYYAVGSDGAIRYAAQFGLPFIANAAFVTPEQMRKRHADYREAIARAGKPAPVGGHPHQYFMYCARSDAEAQDKAFQYLLQHTLVLEHHYERHANHPEYGRHGKQMVMDLEAHKKFNQHFIDTQFIGSPRTCIERIKAMQDAVGFDYALMQVGFGNQPLDVLLPQLELFAAQVMPTINAR